MTAITQESVFQAAEKLAKNGIKPTQQNIRKELGGGSFSTIGQYLREWRKTDQCPTPRIFDELDSIAQREITDAISSLWRKAQYDATKKMEEAREELETRHFDMIQEIKQIEIKIDEYEQDLIAAAQKEKDQAARAEQMQSLINEKTSESDKLKTQNENLKTQNENLENELKKLKELSAQQATELAVSKAYQSSLNANVSRLTDELEQAKNAIKAHQSDQAQSEQDYKKTLEENKNNLANSLTEITKLRTQIESLEAMKKQSDDTLTKYEDTLAKYEARINELTNALIQNQNQNQNNNQK